MDACRTSDKSRNLGMVPDTVYMGRKDPAKQEPLWFHTADLSSPQSQRNLSSIVQA